MMGDVRKVKVGTREMMFPSEELQELEDATHLLGDQEALRKQLDEKGYLLIRGLHKREEVLAGRLEVLKFIEASGAGKFKEGTKLEQGLLDHRCGLGCIPFMEGRNEVSYSESVLKVLEGPRPKSFFKTLLGQDIKTFDYKWLRGIHREGFTGVHVDRVYMCWGTEDLYTMWTPFDDVPVEMGTVVVCEGSHNLPSFQHFQETYGSFDCEKENLKGSGWFTLDPLEITSKFGGQWKTADFKAGDVAIFPMRTVHMSSVNVTEKVRISCDTRWQAASEPTDPRYVGDFQKSESKFGLWVEGEASREQKTMDGMKEIWGI